MKEWLKRNLTIPSMITILTTVILSAVYIRVQGEAIQQMQSGMIVLRGDVEELKKTTLALDRYGSSAVKGYMAVSEKEMLSLHGRLKDVETYNNSINVILTRLGYIEAALNELKRRP